VSSAVEIEEPVLEGEALSKAYGVCTLRSHEKTNKQIMSYR